MRGFGVALRVPRDEGRRRADARSSSTAAVRSAAHGATTPARCPTSTSCSRPRGLCSARLRALPRGRSRCDLARCQAPGHALSWPRGAPGTARRRPATTSRPATSSGSSGTSSSTGARPGATRTASSPRSKPRWNLAGWPFGLVYWPLNRAFGAVAAWNLFVLLGFLGAGGLAALWLRELGLRRGAALTGGLAFALAPYLQAQWGAGHLLAWIAMLLPLSLYGVERARRHSRWWLVLAGVALASIPLSGQLHLALGAIAVLRALRVRPPPLGGRARPPGARSGSPRRLRRGARHDRSERALVRAGRALLGGLLRPLLARSARARDVRLPRLDGPAGRARRDWAC